MSEFNQEYYLEQLSQYHKLFYAVFELGKPIETHQIDTAAVGFSYESGKITFLINPDFFYKLGEKEQLFIICHEALHVVFSHINRTLDFKLDQEIANIAQDIVINELLVNEFDFKRSELNFGATLCFIDTVFNDEQIKKNNIIPGKSFEFYYDLLFKLKDQIPFGISSVDIHLDSSGNLLDDQGNIITAIPEEIAEYISKKIGNQMSEEELEDLLNDLKQGYGTGSNGNIFEIMLEEKKKRPWEKIIKNKISSLQKIKNRNHESFKFRPRRIINLPDNIYLPESREEEINENDKFNLVFFIDASGSCFKYRAKFFNLVKTIPEDKFNITLYSFDTKTYKLDHKKPYIQGGGGTSFQPMENTIQSLKKEDKLFKKKHPDLVFVLSDGDGSPMTPEKPEKWYWLLTAKKTNNIPKNSNIIMLSDFLNI